MNKKGFTLVELIVSFILVTIVMVFFTKTIIVGVQKENKLLSMQEYTAFEATFLKAIGNEVDPLKNKTVNESGNTLTISGSDVSGASVNKTLSLITSEEKSISLNNTVYPLPSNTDFRLVGGKPYKVFTVNANKIIINIFLKHDNSDKTISIILNN